MRGALALFAVMAGGLVLAAGTALADDDKMQNNGSANCGSGHGLGLKQQSASHGDFSLLFDFSTGMPIQTTDLVDCSTSALGVVLQIRGTFDFYDGICDDFEGPKCDDKLIYVAEYCAGSKEPSLIGRIRSDFGRNVVRICYDPNETGQCTATNEVARGFLTAQDQFLVIDDDVLDGARQIGVRTITNSRPFRFNGRRVRIARGGTHVNVFFDLPPRPFDLPDLSAPPVPGRCDGVTFPCGFVVSGIGIGR